MDNGSIIQQWWSIEKLQRWEASGSLKSLAAIGIVWVSKVGVELIDTFLDFSGKNHIENGALLHPLFSLNHLQRAAGLRPQLSPPMTKKSGCGGGMMVIHDDEFQSYSYLTIHTHNEKLPWNAWTSPNKLYLVVNSWHCPGQVWPHSWLKNRLWWPFCTMNSHINLI